MTAPERFQQLTSTEGLRNSLRTRSVRAALFSGSASFVDFALRIGSTAVLARLLLPEDFGLVMMVTAITAIADQFKDFGLSSATIQQKQITHEQATNLFWVNVSVSAAIALVTCSLSPFVAAFYRDTRLVPITCILAANFLFGGLMIQHQALLTRQLKLGHTSAVRLAASASSTVFAIYLAWRGAGYWALVWREVLRAAILTTGMWICFPWCPGLPYKSTSIRALVNFGANMTGANMIGTLAASSDRFLLGRFWGPSPVAIYRQAHQLLLAPMDQLLSPIYQVTMPGLSILQSDPMRFQRFYKKVLTMVCVATMPFSLFVAVYAHEITLLLLGSNWLACAPIISILSLSSFIKQPVESSSVILITRNQSRRYLLLSMTQNAAVILFMLAGVHWGAIGIAVADVAVTYLMIVPKLNYALKDSPVPIRLFFSTVIRPVIASLTMGVILMLVKPMMHSSAPMQLVVSASIGAVCFFSSWTLLPGGRSELMMLILELRAAVLKRSMKITAS